MKIFELKIDDEDEVSGINFLSIVKNPATELSWEIFNDGHNHDCHLHEDLSDKALELFDKYGTLVSDEAFGKATIKQEFAAPPITSNPKAPSFGDDNSDTANVISRYIYVVDTGFGAPLISTSRELCRKLILAQRVFSRTDLQNLSTEIAAMGGESFKLVFRPNYINDVDLFEYKAGKNCRHKWVQVDFPIATDETYEQALSKIPVKANQVGRKGSVLQGGAGRPFISEARYLGMSEENPNNPIALHFGVLLYKTRKAALIAEPTAKFITKVKCGVIEGYAPLDIMEEYFEGTALVVDKFAVKHSFVEVPQYIRDAAKRAVDWTSENGWGDCGTDVGKRRANDLADPSYNASLETLTRMYSYGSRHKVDWESSKSIDEQCGYLMMLSWGFSPDNYDEAMSWLERQIKNATEENMKFSSDEYRGDITSVVFEPDTYIYRYDRDTNTPYYVFMSKDTIRQLLMKLSRMKEMGKISNIVNYEHSGMIFSAKDVYTYENWIVGDDPKKDKSYEIFGREMKPGTWITTIHFKDKRIFDEFIVSNKTTGISLEGNFFEVPFNFNTEKFIEPAPGQSQDDYISECIPFMIKEGYEQDQAAAICYSKWKERFDFPDGTCWEGYEPYGTKIVNGKEVPNCVPIKADVDTGGMVDYLDPDDKDLEVKIEIEFAPYDWDKCISDQTEAYGSKEIAERVCGKIRSENMAMLGVVEGAPVYSTEGEAEEKAKELGCKGTHLMEGYGYSPCSNHNEAIELYNAEVMVYLLERLLEKMDK